MRAQVASGRLCSVGLYPGSTADIGLAVVDAPTEYVDVPPSVAVEAGHHLGREARVLLVIDEPGDDVVRAEVLRAIDAWYCERPPGVTREEFVARMRALAGAS